uniref:NADH-ubiquinone oxidoreductase chain 5 n=1 Tax=Pectinodonta sp. TaxID=3071117 RepID=A0AA96HSG2_9GAST|nr:NADH dehydrogenase subunit 5 [Pectinodonta sp.]
MNYKNNSTKMSLMFLIFLSLILPMISFYLIKTNKSIIVEWEILSISSTSITIPLILDPIGTSFSSIVLIISASVMWFSIFYMKEDPMKTRLSVMIMAFVSTMNFLIFIPNLITLLLGWDGLGMISFILVIYYQNMKSLAAGMITAMSNRVGDVLILISIALLVSQGHWNILAMWNSQSTPTISMLILTAALTKSAQLPFSAWLPAAMAAPTPVSALVHSSTLVTAGIFLLIRFFYFIQENNAFCPTLLFISVLTTIMAGLAAMMENDMKKIIALSTLSQLGVMMASIAMSLPLLALFHLFTHALFKALLFICAGTIIHSNSNTQDIRLMGNLWSQLPLTTTLLNIANLSLCGMPFLSGFYSKDLILENFLFLNTNFIMVFLMFFATGLTTSYSLRLTYSVLWDMMKLKPMHQNTEENSNSTIPMTLLSLFAIFGGNFLQKQFIVFNSYIFLPYSLKMLTVLVILMGLYLATQLFKNTKSPQLNLLIMFIVSNMWFSIDLSSQGMINKMLKEFKLVSKSLDQGWIETSTKQNISLSTKSLINLNINFSNSTINSFALLFVLSSLMIFLF